MSRSPSPRRVTVELEKFHDDGLQQLAGLLPHESEEELLKVVISRGLVEMLKSEFERYPPSASDIAKNMNAATAHTGEPQSRHASRGLKLTVRAQGIDSGRVPFGMTQSLDELHAVELERDREVARMRRDLGVAETPEGETTPSRRMENYIGVPLSEGLRRGVESMLNAQPGLEEESLFSALLELGLKKVQEDPKALQPWAAAQKAALGLSKKEASRQRLRAEWKELCNQVARGWR